MAWKKKKLCFLCVEYQRNFFAWDNVWNLCLLFLCIYVAMCLYFICIYIFMSFYLPSSLIVLLILPFTWFTLHALPSMGISADCVTNYSPKCCSWHGIHCIFRTIPPPEHSWPSHPTFSNKHIHILPHDKPMCTSVYKCNLHVYIFTGLCCLLIT